MGTSKEKVSLDILRRVLQLTYKTGTVTIQAQIIMSVATSQPEKA